MNVIMIQLMNSSSSSSPSSSNKRQTVIITYFTYKCVAIIYFIVEDSSFNPRLRPTSNICTLTRETTKLLVVGINLANLDFGTFLKLSILLNCTE